MCTAASRRMKSSSTSLDLWYQVLQWKLRLTDYSCPELQQVYSKVTALQLGQAKTMTCTAHVKHGNRSSIIQNSKLCQNSSKCSAWQIKQLIYQHPKAAEDALLYYTVLGPKAIFMKIQRWPQNWLQRMAMHTYVQTYNSKQAFS